MKPLIFLLSILFFFLTAEARPHLISKDCESTEEGLWIENEEGLQWVDTSVCEKKKKKKARLSSQEQLNSYFAKSAINPRALGTAEEEVVEEEVISDTTEIGAEAVSVSPELQRQCDEYSQMATQEAVLQGVSPSTISVPEICQQVMAVNPMQDFLDDDPREEEQNNMQNMAPLAAALPGMMGGGNQGGGGGEGSPGTGSSGGDYSSGGEGSLSPGDGDYVSNDAGQGSTYDGSGAGEDTFGPAGGTASSSDVDCMARTLQGEAGGEPVEGIVLVAQVINARVAAKKYPDSICGVVKQGGRPGTTPPPGQMGTQFHGYWSGGDISPRVRNIAEKYARSGERGPYFYFKSAGHIGVEGCAKEVRKVGKHTFYSLCETQTSYNRRVASNEN